jgi:hypothetical protein
MRLYNFCFYVDGIIQAGEFWTWSKDRMKEIILSNHPKATEISIWSIQ